MVLGMSERWGEVPVSTCFTSRVRLEVREKGCGGGSESQRDIARGVPGDRGRLLHRK